jgi:hypothetical protein
MAGDLCLATGITAMLGGLVLVASPDGALVHMSTAALAHSPFPSFLVPGLVLLFVVGGSNARAGWLVLRDHPGANARAFVGGAALFGWIVAEMVMLRTVHLMHVAYFAIAVVTMTEALRRTRAMTPAARAPEALPR